jgi:hypothetical protein
LVNTNYLFLYRECECCQKKFTTKLGLKKHQALKRNVSCYRTGIWTKRRTLEASLDASRAASLAIKKSLAASLAIKKKYKNQSLRHIREKVKVYKQSFALFQARKQGQFFSG